MSKVKVLVACEESQRVCIAFRELGHEAYSCDIQECSGGHPEWHIQQDVILLLNGFCEFKTLDGKTHKLKDKWDLIIAHPPCTWFSNATMVNLGRKDHPEVFNEQWRKNFYVKQRQAFDFFLAIWNCNCEHIAIENVVGWLNTHFRKPTQIIQPFYFGDAYRKTTCLWLYNLPKLEPTNIVEPTCKWVKHNLKSRNDLVGYEQKGVYGSKNRATTFKGVAEAMATQWSEYILKEQK